MNRHYDANYARKLKATLDALPPKPNRQLTKRAVVDEVREAVATLMRKKGYSTSDVLAILKAEGLDISAKTLAVYLRGAKGKRRPRDSDPSAAAPDAADATPKAVVIPTRKGADPRPPHAGLNEEV